jgi:hypothetical protein
MDFNPLQPPVPSPPLWLIHPGSSPFTIKSHY